MSYPLYHNEHWFNLAERLDYQSKTWFPDVYAHGEWHKAVHFTLGLAGEVGELVNLIKKVNRNDSDIDLTKVGHEMADIFVYLSLLAYHFQINLIDVTDDKISVLYKRWGNPYARIRGDR